MHLQPRAKTRGASKSAGTSGVLTGASVSFKGPGPRLEPELAILKLWPPPTALPFHKR